MGVVDVTNAHSETHARHPSAEKQLYAVLDNQKCNHAKNVAKKALPENVATFVGGYVFGNLIPKNVAVPENVAYTDPTENLATSPEM